MIALLAFAIAGSLLWFALPGSALIALPYWVARVAVRYHRPGPAEWAVVGIATVGTAVPFYLTSHSDGVTFGALFGMAALVLASINRRNREIQLEEREVSLARKQTALEEHGAVRLTVEDKPGRRPERAASGGYGLIGMRERADLLGGSLETGPTATGWRIELKVPG